MQALSAVILSFINNGTRQLLLRVVGWTGATIAGGLRMVEESTFSTSCTPWDALWILVDTLKTVPVVSVVFCHQVSTVLQCPPRRAVIPRWYNVDHRSSANTANGTWNVVLMYTWKGRAST